MPTDFLRYSSYETDTVETLSHHFESPEIQLSQAARFVTHLQLQLSELDRREHHLNIQLANLSVLQENSRRESRIFSERIASAEAELASREAKLREAELKLQTESEAISLKATESERQHFAQIQQRLRFERDLKQLEQDRLHFEEKEARLALQVRNELEPRELRLKAAESKLTEQATELGRMEYQFREEMETFQRDRQQFEEELEARKLEVATLESQANNEWERFRNLEEREQQLKRAEATLFERTGELAQQAEEIRQQQTEFEKQQLELEQALQQRFTEEIQKGLEIRQRDLDVLRLELEAREAALEEKLNELESFQVRHQLVNETFLSEKRIWESDRARLLAEQQQTLSEKSADLQRQQDELVAERERLAAESQQLLLDLASEQEQLDIARKSLESQVQQQADQKLAEQAEQLRSSLVAEFETLEVTLREQHAGLLEQVKNREQELEQLESELRSQIEVERNQKLEQLEEQQNLIFREQAELQGQREELERQALKWEERKTAERQEFLNELEDQSRERLVNLDLRESELERREIDSQKRMKLHESHLENARKELTQQRDQMVRQQQRHRNWTEQTETSVRLRLNHIRRFRDLLAQRESSLAEEKKIVDQQVKNALDQLNMQREGLLAERNQFVSMRQQERDILDRCHERLEHDHAGFVQICGELAPTLDDLRSVIHLITDDSPESQSLRPTLDQVVLLLSHQILTLERTQSALTLQQSEQQAEQTRFTQWFEERENRIAEREELFNQQLQEFVELTQQAQAEHDRWHQERVEVERIVRELVLKVEESCNRTSQDQPRLSDVA